MTPGITVNTQSSIRIKGSDGIIRFDPFKITGEPHDTDMIFITHDHYDHFSPEDIRKVSKPGTVLIAPKNMAGQLKAQGFTNILLLAPDETAALHNIRIEAVAAYNSLKPFHPKSKGNLGYVITADGQRIYAAGDTDAVREIKAIKCDVALVPIGGTFTMNPEEAAALVNEIKPAVAIPIHYGSIVGSMSCGEAFRSLVSADIETKLLLNE